MVRKLKFHEQKLLKKVDFISWKSDNNLREVKILRKYHIQKREDDTKYNKLSGLVTSLANKIKQPINYYTQLLYKACLRKLTKHVRKMVN